MHIATWNINSIKVRHHHIHQWLTANPVDCLLLQELKNHDEALLQTFSQLGYSYVAALQKTYNGVAILYKEQPQWQTSVTLINDQLLDLNQHTSEPQARFLHLNYHNYHILNLYVPNGNPINSIKFEYKLTWLQHLLNYATALYDKCDRIIIAGDFNIAPTSNDVYSTQAFQDDAIFHLDCIAIYQQLINLGFYNVIDYKNTSHQHYTWWDYRGNGFYHNHGARIDHILVSPALMDQLISCYIDVNPRKQEQPSDHTPVIANFNSV